MSLAPKVLSLPLHAHGSPNWVDLHTGTIDTARTFYEAMFGWGFRNRFSLSPVPDGAHHEQYEPTASLMALCNDKPTAELVERNEAFDDMALLSNWFSYVYVDDLAETLAKVEPAGGLVLSPPAPRGTMARVATILDPSDALLCLWEADDLGGSDTLHENGSLTWIELETPDLDSAVKFYGELFGWDAAEIPVIEGAYLLDGCYTLFTKNGTRVAGAVTPPTDDIPASWCPSFAVDDVENATRTAIENGGVLMAEPTNTPVGRQAVIVDPTGAVFSILGPKLLGPRAL